MGVMQRIQGYVNSIVGTYKVTELFIRNERRDDEAIAVLKELFCSFSYLEKHCRE